MTESKLKLYGFYSELTFHPNPNCKEVASSNPIKITMALEELGLKYEYIVLNVPYPYGIQLTFSRKKSMSMEGKSI